MTWIGTHHARSTRTLSPDAPAVARAVRRHSQPPAPSTEFATEPIPILRTAPSKTARCYPELELRGGQPPASCLSPVWETHSDSEGGFELVEGPSLTGPPWELQETFRRENDALRAQTSVMSSQIADLASKNAEVSLQNAMLSSQMAAMSAQMSAILVRLEALTNYSGGACHSSDAVRRTHLN